MPIYEFECPKCGATVEVLRRGSIGQEEYVEPKCSDHEEPVKMEKQLSDFAGKVEGGTPKFH